MGENIDGQASARQAGFAGVTRKVLERLALPGDHRELAVVEVTSIHPVASLRFTDIPSAGWSSSSKVSPSQLMAATIRDSTGQATPCRTGPIFHTPCFAIVT